MIELKDMEGLVQTPHRPCSCIDGRCYVYIKPNHTSCNLYDCLPNVLVPGTVLATINAQIYHVSVYLL